jgi:hypothetical protein
MPDGVHATLESQEPAVGQPVVDRVLTEPESQQLPPRHHAVLACRQLMDRVKPAHIAG